jgi:hypothetical protein
MAFERVAVVLSLGCVLVLIGQSPSAAATKKKAARSDPALPTVEKVLRAEVAGGTDRREQLAATLKEYPDSVPARWQAGFVKVGDSWRSFDEVRHSDSAGLSEEYRRRREDASKTFPGQLDLANWCRKQGLKDLERVHLRAAVSLASDDEQPALLERLGYSRIGTQWVSDEQKREWQNTLRQTKNLSENTSET